MFTYNDSGILLSRNTILHTIVTKKEVSTLYGLTKQWYALSAHCGLKDID